LVHLSCGTKTEATNKVKRWYTLPVALKKMSQSETTHKQAAVKKKKTHTHTRTHTPLYAADTDAQVKGDHSVTQHPQVSTSPLGTGPFTYAINNFNHKLAEG